MAKVLTHMCMSLDGFVAQPDDNPAELFDWYWNGEVVVPSAQENMSFSVDAASAPMLQELTSGCGAIVAGRRGSRSVDDERNVRARCLFEKLERRDARKIYHGDCTR